MRRLMGDSDDLLIRGVLTASLVLNLGVGAALASVDVSQREVMEETAVRGVTVMEFEDADPLPRPMEELPEPTESAEVERVATSETPSATRARPARSANAGGSPNAAAASGRGDGGSGDGAAAADAAFMSAFGGGPGGAGAGGSGDVSVRRAGGDAIGGDDASPRSGIGDGSGRMGRSDIAGGGGDVSGSLGTGGDGAKVERRGSVSVKAPNPSRAAAGQEEGVSAGASGAAVEAIGTQVRRRESQIRFCYEEQGLKVNPDLAGSLRIEFTVNGGSVRNARVTRGLSGAGSDATEACVLDRVRGWTFQGVDETVTIPFTFVLSR